MTVRCPRCRQKLTIADKHAGKVVRCPSCNRAFSVPKPQAAVNSGAEPGVDLEGLAQLESSSGVLSKKELAKIGAAQAAGTEEVQEGTLRICPNCQKQTPVDDPYADVLCSQCWQPIPARIKGGRAAITVERRRARARSTEGPAAFYSELTSCLTYPLPAAGSIVAAAVVAIVAALVPAAVITGGTKLMQEYGVGTAEELIRTDLSIVTVLLLSILGVEVLFFLAVALHLFLDVIRTTFTRTDRPPNLAWAPSQWSKSLAACLLLAAYYALMTYLVATITVGSDVLKMVISGHARDILPAGGTNLIIGAVLVTLAVPMSLVGISLTSVLRGMNPVQVIRSIARTHAHYAFLVLLLSVYVILFTMAFIGILFEWLLPLFEKMVKGSAEGDLVQVALALMVWGLVMGFFFYGTYVLARLHGVFARAFQGQLTFMA